MSVGMRLWLVRRQRGLGQAEHCCMYVQVTRGCETAPVWWGESPFGEQCGGPAWSWRGSGRGQEAHERMVVLWLGPRC